MEPMLWSGWGDPARARDLPADVRSLLRDLLGGRGDVPPAVSLEEVRLPPPAPVPDALEKTGAWVLTDHESRVRHTRGKSTPDLVRIRSGDGSSAPSAVVLPGSHAEVVAVLSVCAAHRIPVVPFGGGTSVVGGLTPHDSGFIAIDLGRMDRLVDVDTTSMVATFEPGVRGPEAERLLSSLGLTLGHFPQSFEYATLGGFAAARSSGQASAGYGRFDDMVVGVTLATPRGTLELGRAPKSGAGPDLRQLVLGSEGAFGIITSLRLRVRRAPAERVYEGWRFESFEAGSAALRAVAQEGVLPTVLRLSDETETLIGLARPDAIGTPTPSDGPPSDGPASDGPASDGPASDGPGSGGPASGGPGSASTGPASTGAGASSGGWAAGGGCLAVVGYEGAAVAARRTETSSVLSRNGGEPMGEEPGKAWEHGRYSAPYLRDSLLKAGALVETLETATFWSNIPRLYDAVRLTLLGSLGNPLVMCHISHVYETGASLYFTVVTAQPLQAWERAKTEVNQAIVEAGGTISHHHGVGRDHRDAYAAELGPLGVEILRAVKERLDPEGIMNPGALIP